MRIKTQTFSGRELQEVVRELNKALDNSTIINIETSSSGGGQHEIWYTLRVWYR